MNTHLRDEQIADILIGAPVAAADLHLKTCEDCRAQVASLEGVLGNFRSSAYQLSEAAYRPMQVVPRPSFGRLGFTLAGAVLAVIGIVSIQNWQQTKPQPAILQSDIALLMQIDAQVSRGIPEAMEPLSQFLPKESN